MKLSNNEIKRIRQLSQKKFRDETGLFVVEGEKMVAEAQASGFVVEAVYRREEIGEETMARISQLASPSPVLAVVRQPSGLELTAGDIAGILCGDRAAAWGSAGMASGGSAGTGSGPRGLYLALDRLRDPGNLGTILRIADWFGIDAVFASPDSVDIFNPKVVQATMGAIFRVRFHYTDILSACKAVSTAGGSVYGTFLDGDIIYNSDLNPGTTSPSLIITGNESDGISPAVSAACTHRLFIPSFGFHAMESLNAAIATAITVSEFRRKL